MARVFKLNRIFPVLCVFVVVLGCSFFARADVKKSVPELMQWMKDIDLKYKKGEVISGYFEYDDENWDDLLDAGTTIAEITEKVQAKYGRPENKDYQKLMELMRAAAEKMGQIAKNERGKAGALEDVQWQVRLLRNSCANCHKLLKIHIYPNLYPEGKHRLRSGGVYDDWGKPD